MNARDVIRSIVSKIISGVAVLTLLACMQIDFAVVNAPTYFDQTTVISDVPYGPQDGQKLDIYLPSNASEELRDVVVFFYGGRWTTGSKNDYRFVGSAFANKGFVTIIADYSKYPQVRFPAFVEDAAKTVSWVYDHSADYGGNPARIHLAGHSAGAHIAALLAADAHYLKAEGKNRSIVIYDFAGLAGPYDFTPDEPDLQDMFGPPSRYPLMQVPTFIDGTQPPMLLLYGDSDTDVKISNLEKLLAHIQEKGGCAPSIIYHGVDHIGIVAALSWLNPDHAPVLDDMVSFFTMHHPAQAACLNAASK